MATALYRAFNQEKDLLYVGISMRTYQRFCEHAKHSGWFEQTSNLSLTWFETRTEALSAERKAIISERPKYNIQHNALKSEHDKKADDFERDEITNDLVTGRAFQRVKLKPLYTLKEAGDLLSLSPSKIRRMIDDLEIGAVEWSRQTKRVGNIEEKKEVVTYRISGWQILDFLDSKGAR